jgi:hypothetical protein
MATRARIGIIDDTTGGTTVRSIYLHSDGYLDGAGAALLAGFNDEELALALVDAGDHSTIGKGGPDDGDTRPYAEMGHNADEVSAQTHPVHAWPDSGQQFEYLWSVEDREWLYRAGGPRFERLMRDDADLENGPSAMDVPAEAHSQSERVADCGTDVASYEINEPADAALVDRLATDAGFAGAQDELDANAIAWLWRHAVLGLEQDLGFTPRRIDVARRVIEVLGTLYAEAPASARLLEVTTNYGSHPVADDVVSFDPSGRDSTVELDLVIGRVRSHGHLGLEVEYLVDGEPFVVSCVTSVHRNYGKAV